MNKISILWIVAALCIACQKEDAPSSAKPVAETPVQFVYGSDLDSLPKDTGGLFEAFPLKTNASPYGYYVYTPSGYTVGGTKFPLLIFLHGEGELGDSTQAPAAISRILAHGPPMLINEHQWTPRYPMVVVSPQCHLGWWDPARVRAYIEFVIANYRVDTTRIYITGLSMGGFGTFDQMTNYGKNSHLAAAVSISGGGTVDNDQELLKASAVPFWGFHGEKDTVYTPGFDILIHQGMLALHPAVNPKLTLYPNAGHDAWTETYDGTGMGQEDPLFDPFKLDIYSWMFQYRKGKVNAN
jgi:poly(3-hydroxybutyrate) depolymerase